MVAALSDPDEHPRKQIEMDLNEVILFAPVIFFVKKFQNFNFLEIEQDNNRHLLPFNYKVDCASCQVL